MSAWGVWRVAVERLRPAFSRRRAFLWFLAAVAAFAVREDLNGVTSFVRVLGLEPVFYHALLRMFHSTAVDVDRLAALWTQTLTSLLAGRLLEVGGKPVFATDGVKVAKSGRKMPAVKTMHQESDSNTKPEYVNGHSCLSVSLMAVRNGEAVAVPVGTRIAEGVKFNNRDRRTIYDRTVSFLDAISPGRPFLLLKVRLRDTFDGDRHPRGGLLLGELLVLDAHDEHLAHAVRMGRAACPAQDAPRITRGRGPGARMGEIHPRAHGPEAIPARGLTSQRPNARKTPLSLARRLTLTRQAQDLTDSCREARTRHCQACQ